VIRVGARLPPLRAGAARARGMMKAAAAAACRDPTLCRRPTPSGDSRPPAIVNEAFAGARNGSPRPRG
jgi:hypothetical protein